MMKNLIFLLFFFTYSAFASPSAIDFSSGKLRGFNANKINLDGSIGATNETQSDFSDMAATKANLLRVFVPFEHTIGQANYSVPAPVLATVENILSWGGLYGFKVVIVAQPVDQNNNVPIPGDFWANQAMYDSLAQAWRQLASAVKSYPALEAYDLINEPYPQTLKTESGPYSSSESQWETLSEELMAYIRQVDTTTPFVWESLRATTPYYFNKTVITPSFVAANPGVVYSFHYYNPWTYAAQGIGNPNHTPVSYPSSGTVSLSTITSDLASVVAFQNTYHVPIYVGEFNAVRWAAGGNQYVADLIKQFESHGWSWTFYAWRPNYDGWDAELTDTSYRPQAHIGGRSSTTSKILTMESWFQRNK